MFTVLLIYSVIFVIPLGLILSSQKFDIINWIVYSIGILLLGGVLSTIYPGFTYIAVSISCLIFIVYQIVYLLETEQDRATRIAKYEEKHSKELLQIKEQEAIFDKLVVINSYFGDSAITAKHDLETLISKGIRATASGQGMINLYVVPDDEEEARKLLGQDFSDSN